MDYIEQDCFTKYDLLKYKKDISIYGLEKTWDYILNSVKNSSVTNEIFQVNNFGELYEIGLAYANKIEKKELGKFYTPHDVANIMTKWLIPLKGENLCDVCCGTGNLILSYLSLIGKRKAINLLKNKRIFLYDIDKIALNICKYSIAILYGIQYLQNINTYCCDFLDRDIVLPENSKVISNPPYFKITKINDKWDKTLNVIQSKEFYSAIMEKILYQSKSSVIITPYSFMGGNKFYELRKTMNNYNGFIVSFDNVPGNIFCGRKHGIFNSNSTNSVRAAITVTQNIKNIKGYRLSPLIRFKNEERNNLLISNVLENTISQQYQIITEKEKSYYKCFKECEELFITWNRSSNQMLKDIIVPSSEFKICVPNSCRYYTVGTIRDLQRTGKNTLYFKTKEDRDLVYCLLNSSFAYWYWRLYDGGITYSISLLKAMPIFLNKITLTDKEELLKIATTLQAEENNYLVYKKNASQLQENIKFPKKYRHEINDILGRILNSNTKILEIIHKNSFFSSNEGSDNCE